jgi:hypothetical protein
MLLEYKPRDMRLATDCSLLTITVCEPEDVLAYVLASDDRIERLDPGRCKLRPCPLGVIWAL